jgi:hypothetical protein
VQRQQPGLAELAVAHPQQPVVIGVQVVAVQPDRLADAHPGDGQQADQGLVGRCGQRMGQHAGGMDDGGDVGGRVEEGGCPPWPAAEQSWWRDLDTGVEGVQVDGEAANRRQPLRPPARGGIDGQHRPGQRILDGDHRNVTVV